MKTVYKAISTEAGNKGKVSGFSKSHKLINGKLQSVFLTKEEFVTSLKESTWESFEILEVK